MHSNRTEASTNLPSSSKKNDYHTSSRNTGRVSERHTKGNIKTKRNTVIVGDSIMKYVKGWELSNRTQRVTVKSFPGANLEDMDDFINPILRKKPDQLVLHIGTNDLRRAESQVVAHGVIKAPFTLYRITFHSGFIFTLWKYSWVFTLYRLTP